MKYIPVRGRSSSIIFWWKDYPHNLIFLQAVGKIYLLLLEVGCHLHGFLGWYMHPLREKIVLELDGRVSQLRYPMLIMGEFNVVLSQLRSLGIVSEKIVQYGISVNAFRIMV